MPQLFLFLGRSRSKSDTKPEVESGGLDSEDEVPTESSEPKKTDDNGLEGKLSRTEFPVKKRSELMKALGGRDVEIRVGTKVYQAVEIVDRCFAGRDLFRSPQDVVEALSGTSWTQVVMDKLHMLPFPVKSRDQLAVRLKGTLVEGVPIMDILDNDSFPIETPSDLLAKLAGSRSSVKAGDGMETARSTPDEDEIPSGVENLQEDEGPLEGRVQLVEEAS